MATLLTYEREGLFEKLGQLRANIESVFIGKTEAISQLLVGLLARGHVLIEDVPGVGRRSGPAPGQSIDCRFRGSN
jgi:MoxR-like ATPase